MPKSRPPKCTCHGPTTQGARRYPPAHTSPSEPLAEVFVREQYPYPGTESTVVHRQVLERNRHTEVNRRQQRFLRASTPAFDRANWGSLSSPVSNRFSGARAGFARNQDMTEHLTTGWLSELQLLEDCRPPETLSENGVIQTYEPEGGDALFALEAQKQEYLATEERRLDELMQAEDRIRELQQQNKALTSTIREMIYLENDVTGIRAAKLQNMQRTEPLQAARPNNAQDPALNPTTTVTKGLLAVSEIDRKVGHAATTKEVPGSVSAHLNGYFSVEDAPVSCIVSHKQSLGRDAKSSIADYKGP
ncbi:MAG: hypothetical protein Q9199_005034 [Rusavskia elegans]